MARGTQEFFPGFEFSSSDMDAITGVLRASMQLGMPEDETKRPLFFFGVDRTFTSPGATTAAGTPFNRDITPEPEPEGVPILCAYEDREGEADESTIGSFESKEMILTFLPEEWEEAKDFTYVKIGGRRFDRSYPLAEYGLQESGAIQIRVEAKDI